MRTLRRRLLLAATFLFALAVGVALGAGPLSQPSEVIPGADKPAQQDPALAAFESGFVEATADDAIAGTLRNRKVVLISVAGASSGQVDRVRASLEAADAEVVSQPAFAQKLIDPANRQFVDSVARQAALKVREVVKGPASYQRIGSALARALLGDAGDEPDELASAIWEAFVEGELVSGDQPNELGNAVVMVVGPQRNGATSKVTAELLRAMASHAEGTVMAGPATSSLSGGAIAAVRTGPAAEIISSVDVADSVAGPIVVVLALEADAKGDPGAWGTPRSADGPLPDDSANG